MNVRAPRTRAAALFVSASGAAGLALSPPSAPAETDAEKFPGQPSVENVSPRGWHRGAEVELAIVGRGLFAPKDLLFYRPGIEVLSVAEADTRPMDDRERYDYRRRKQDEARRAKEEFDAEALVYPPKESKPGERVVAKLRIAADAEPGEYPFRLHARGGMGSLMTFWVGSLPTVAEDEPATRGGENEAAEDAQEVALGSTVNGAIAPYDKDVFKVRASAGQRITAEVEAVRLAISERNEYLDLQLTLRDAGGAVLATADDSDLFLEDPYLSAVAPADGDYFITAEESVPTGSSRGPVYRLHLHDGPRPAALFPPGGRPGERLKSRALAADGTELGEFELKLPEAPGAHAARLADGAPSGTPVRVFDGTNVIEAEPNGAPDNATGAGASAPVALNGILAEDGDLDIFRVRLDGGKRYTVQLFGAALGSPIDARMWIAPADRPDKRQRSDDCGEEELGVAMAESVRDRLDPAMTFEPDAGGDYLIGVENGRGTGAPHAVYRVEIAEASTGVLTAIVPRRNNEPRYGNRVQVFPGGRFNAVVALSDAFGSEAEGEFELVADGLPAGVTLKAPRFSSANTRLPVVFEAAPGAEPEAALVELRARPAGGGGALPGGFRSTVPFNGAGGNRYLYHVFLDKLAVGVVEGAPFTVEVDAPKAALTQDGELPIQVRVERRPGFEGSIEIDAPWLPPNCGRSSPIVLRSDETEAQFIVGARRNTPPEDYQLALTAITREGDRRTGDRVYFASTPLVPLRVVEPYLSARMPRVAVEIGKTSEFTVTLEPITEFEGRAKAVLDRLPDGIEMVGGPVEFSPGDTELNFTVRATDAALTGTYRGMRLELEFTDKGQAVTQISGYGTLRVDAKRGKVAAQ